MRVQKELKYLKYAWKKNTVSQDLSTVCTFRRPKRRNIVSLAFTRLCFPKSSLFVYKSFPDLDTPGSATFFLQRSKTKTFQSHTPKHFDPPYKKKKIILQ